MPFTLLTHSGRPRWGAWNLRFDIEEKSIAVASEKYCGAVRRLSFQSRSRQPPSVDWMATKRKDLLAILAPLRFGAAHGRDLHFPPGLENETTRSRIFRTRSDSYAIHLESGEIWGLFSSKRS